MSHLGGTGAVADMGAWAAARMPRDLQAPAGGRHLAFGADGVRFVDPARAAAQPAVWVEAFRVAIASGRTVSEQVRACIRDRVEQYTVDDFVATEGERTQLRHLLHPRAGLHARLLDMQACGLLGALFPEIEHLRPRPVREVFPFRDERPPLLPIRLVELLRETTEGVRARFATLLDDIQSPEMLGLALLLAPPASGRACASVPPDDAAGNDGVQSALDRLQLPDESRRTVEFLIENRHAMARVAFRGGAADPDLVARFAERVGRDARLAMLTVLTAVTLDARDDDPAIAWKETLLWRLYVECRHRLAFGDAAADDRGRAALAVVLAGRPADVMEADLATYVAAIPDAYFAVFGVASIFPHLRLLRGLAGDTIHASLEQHGRLWQLTIAARRRAVLFPRALGVLSPCGLQVHRGQTIPMPEGIMLLVFEFSDETGLLRDDPAATADLLSLLDMALGGRVDAGALVDGPDAPPLPDQPRCADVAWSPSAHCTIVTITTAADRARFHLYRSVGTIVGEGCEVQVALVEPGDRFATIVLHVTQAGQGVSGPWQRLLDRRLSDALPLPA